MKACAYCGRNKPLSQFYIARSTPDGHRHVCKPCDNKHRALNARRSPHLADRFRGAIRKRKIKLCKSHPECAIIRREEVRRRGGGICGICGKKLRPSWHMDHIIPVSKGGIHCYYNLQPAHIKCNIRKGNSVGTTQSGS